MKWSWLQILLGITELRGQQASLQSDVNQLIGWRNLHEVQLQDEISRLRSELERERSVSAKLTELLEKKVSAPVTISPSTPIRQPDARAVAVAQMTSRLMEEPA